MSVMDRLHRLKSKTPSYAGAMLKALNETGSVAGAARALGIRREALHRYMKQWDIRKTYVLGEQE